MNMTTTNLPAAPPARSRNILVAVGFGIAAVLMYFGGLFGVYLRERSQVRSVGGSWIPEKAQIELTPPGMIIWTLLISVAVMQWAVYSIKRDDRQHALLAVGTTLAMLSLIHI